MSNAAIAIECGPELDIAQTKVLHGQLLEAIASGQPLAIDTREVQRIHAAALQLFACLMAESRTTGLKVHWSNVSSVFLNSAKLLGLSEVLGLPEKPDS